MLFDTPLAEDFTALWTPNPEKHGLCHGRDPQTGRKKVETRAGQHVTLDHISAHLGMDGQRPMHLGYLAGTAEGTTVGCLDLDAKDFPGDRMAEVRQAVISACQAHGLQPYPERSSSGQGWHIWVFLDLELPYAVFKRALQALLREAGIKAEVYPLGDGPGGRWVLMPYHAALQDPKRLGLTFLETVEGQPIPIDELSTVVRSSGEVVQRLAELPQGPPQAEPTQTSQPPAADLAPEAIDALLGLARQQAPRGGRHDALLAFLNLGRRAGSLPRMAQGLQAEEVRLCWCPDGSRDAATWHAEIQRLVEHVQQPTAGPERGLTYLRETCGYTLPDLSRRLPWEAPLPLPPETPPAPQLSPELIPAPFRPWLVDAQERLCVPLAYLAVVVLVALSILVGRSLRMRPKREDDWTVVVNLSGAIVGPPGVLKTPAFKEALRCLKALEAQARQAYLDEWRSKAALRETLEIEIASIKERLREAAKKGADLSELQAALEDKQRALHEATPVELRYTTSDATVAKLGELLAANPRGVLCERDELNGLLDTMRRKGQEGDREFFLEAMNGDGQYRVDRIGRGSIDIQSMCLSVIGGIQPGKLRAYIQEALGGERGADGLLQRFSLLVWPDELGAWRNVDRRPDLVARQRAMDLFTRVDQLDPARIGAQLPEHGLPSLGFDPEAQQLFDAWRDDLEVRLRGPALHAHPAFAAHLSKYRKLMPSLALLFHLTEVLAGGQPGPVSLEAARLAAAWCEFLEAHAAKVYGLEQHRAAHSLAARIEQGVVYDGMTVRELYRSGWKGLSTPDAALEALTALEQLNWVRLELVTTGGRPAQLLRLNPALLGSA